MPPEHDRTLRQALLHMKTVRREMQNLIRYGIRTNLLREVRNVQDMDGTGDTENGHNTVPGLDAMFEAQINHILSEVQEARQNIDSRDLDEDVLEEHEPRDSGDDVFEELDILIDAQGASEQEINGLGEHIATNGDAGEVCVVCLELIKTGDEIRTLQCTHCFHRQCIDDWLRISATCPKDRSSIA